MKLGDYILPSPLVVQKGWNLDTLIYISLLTIFNPIIVWIFYFTDKVSKGFAFTIVFFWICRYLNACLRRTEVVAASRKIVLITGGATGLGLELVKEWSSRQDVKKIIVVDVKKPEDNLEKVYFLRYDLRDINLDLNGLFVGRGNFDLSEIDVLVCNAGLRQVQTIQELKEQDIHNIIRVNWLSHLVIIKKYIDCIKEQEKKRRFHVVVVGSVLGFVGPKKLGLYAGTKNALMALMDSLREELPSNIVLSTILPGQLDSAMFADVNVNQFLAPVISSKRLAKRISAIVEEGLNGTFAYPLYGRLLPVYRVLPWCIQRFCRWFSGMDNV